jgi:predicted nucleotide-binding protein (sugar kinase/HSP70/actin superfamily)
MTYGGARTFAAAFRSVGIDATLSPESDERTRELGGMYTSGDECYPAIVTLGNFMKVILSSDFKPEKTAFFMPTANGPCRFGQYAPYLRKLLDEMGYPEAMVCSPSSANGYDGVGEHAGELMRTGWRALVAADLLRKKLLQTRPYEVNRGETDQVYEECLDLVCSSIEVRGIGHERRMERMAAALEESRRKFNAVPIEYDEERPLIGVVGEIFCRLNRFSNDNLLRVIEEQGGEAWLADVSEWVWYTNWGQTQKLLRAGKRFSREMLRTWLKNVFQKRDEHALLDAFHGDFVGYEEPKKIEDILEYSRPYLPPEGALGEMVLNVGKTVYLYNKGADGVVDISPFTCMNGITCEAIYPDVSRDHEGIPIKIFYFDGTQSDLDRDVGIFIELAKTYKRRKSRRRVLPPAFAGV